MLTMAACSDGGNDANSKVKGGGAPTTVSIPGSDGDSSGADRDDSKTVQGTQPVDDGGAPSTHGGSG